MANPYKEFEAVALENAKETKTTSAKVGIYVVADLETEKEKADVIREFQNLAISKTGGKVRHNAFAYALIRHYVENQEE